MVIVKQMMDIDPEMGKRAAKLLVLIRYERSSTTKRRWVDLIICLRYSLISWETMSNTSMYSNGVITTVMNA